MLKRILVLALVASGCASTSATVRVERAPEVSFRGGQPVGVNVRVLCRDLAVGPDRAEKVVGPGSTVTVLAERANSCPPGYGDDMGGAMSHELEQQLAVAGFEPAMGKTLEQNVQVLVTLDRFREVNPWTQRNCLANDTTCSKGCGSSSCAAFVVKGRLDVKVTYAGPALEGVPVQNAERQVSTIALIRDDPYAPASEMGTRYSAVGSDGRQFFEDRNYDWDISLAAAKKWATTTAGQVLKGKVEEVSLELFKTSGSPDTDAGIAAGKVGDWAKAVISFKAALAGLEKRPPVAARTKAWCLHNLAVAQLQQEDLDGAIATALNAIAAYKESATEELLKEAHQRKIDTAKMKAATAPPPPADAPVAPQPEAGVAPGS